jgi:hypothetical protein
MAGPIPARSGRIFISYRREETSYPAGWLFDRLAERFGAGQVFKDVDSIELGDDFVEVITRAVGSCDVLLALIGDEWLTITDAHGRRRLENPDDFVRLEIEAALTRGVRVIPILVDGANMPHADELPDSLAKLVRRQALELSPNRFDFDTSRLLRVLDKTLAEEQVQREAEEQHAGVDSAGRADPEVGGATPSEVSAGQPVASPPTPRRRVEEGSSPGPWPRRLLPWVAAGLIVLAVAVLVVAQLGSHPETAASNRAATSTAAPATTVPPTASDALEPGETLRSGQRLDSEFGSYSLVMARDGYLLLSMRPARLIWSRGNGVPGTRLSNRSDGNIVLVTPKNQLVWQTRTAGHRGTRLVLQDDGNLVVYAPGDKVLWESGIPG